MSEAVASAAPPAIAVLRPNSSGMRAPCQESCSLVAFRGKEKGPAALSFGRRTGPESIVRRLV
jgi:hypothetical protein